MYNYANYKVRMSYISVFYFRGSTCFPFTIKKVSLQSGMESKPYGEIRRCEGLGISNMVGFWQSRISTPNIPFSDSG
jgi:hypothetical protein